jgi:hypothetical protein
MRFGLWLNPHWIIVLQGDVGGFGIVNTLAGACAI